ncbi:hypothetical protein SH1V18_18080 [Vallitalea longa]|uniref:Uncharacterized protein n=1 Tax=Vallitalea longa TaxID=2936439 RepID=A0A9W6DFD1_9FIRM|nr:hypothetical protein [Vallitalea longa]GKX29328.1 hypothetical protein SH1V18_18080 [Vallitalea longa]
MTMKKIKGKEKIMKLNKLSIITILSAFVLFVACTSVYAMTEAIEMPDGTVKFKRNYQDVDIQTSESTVFDVDGKIYRCDSDGELIEINPEEIEDKWDFEEYTAKEYEQYINEFIANHEEYMEQIKNSEHFTQPEIEEEQKIFEETLAIMQEQLEAIKSGEGFVCKPIVIDEYVDENGVWWCNSISSSGTYGEVGVGISVGGCIDDKEFGPFDTTEEFNKAVENYLQDEVETGRMTEEEADKIRKDFEEQTKERSI